MREVEILKKKQLKCYLYTRVSTSMQVDGYSLDAQRDKLRKYAAYEDMIVAGEYSDEGFSGKNIQGRQEFQRMLNDIQDGKDDVSYVLVFKLSRFGRNAADVLNSLQLMQDFGVNLICVEDGIDSSKDAGKLMISVLSAVAEIERENIRTQTMAGREQKAREGKWNGGFAPYGYKLENGNLVIAEDEVEVIRVIYDRYIHTNEGVAGVAKYLNRNGYTKKLRQNNTIPGFSRDFVKNVLYNPVYMGKIAYGRRRTEKKQGTRNEMHVVEQSEFPVYEGQHEASYYLSLYTVDSIDKERIYELTAKINNGLHFEFGIKNLYHRMIFTACALVAERYGAGLRRLKDMGYATFHTAIHSTLSKSLEDSRKQNAKIDILLEEYSDIKMNTTDNQQAINDFIDWVVEISECVNSNEWRGEDVMGIFFNEFNRYKKKSEAGQVFTPEHITDFMYKILDVNKDDYILDATCGSGGFLVKAMANMIREAGGMQADAAAEIKSNHLYGIEFDREIYALACANMLIHKDGKTNLEQMDARTDPACKWMKSKPITKVLMNPPYENKYGCMKIVENVLDNVPAHTQCAFILPDKKLEKASKAQMKRILKNHRLRKVIKLPEDLFFGVGITTSIFVFEAGVGQDGKEFFACYMESDGLATVKNKGRHDIYGKWAAIEAHWVEVMEKQSGDDTCQWVNPAEHLSYQVPQKPFEIFEEDFRKTAMDYLMFQKRIDVKTFGEKLMTTALYSSQVSIDDETVTVSMQKGGDGDDEN